MDAHGAAYSRRRRHLRSAARPGLQPFQPRVAWHPVDLVQFVPLNDPIKISRLTLQNRFRTRAAHFDHGVCRVASGSSRTASAPYVVTEVDSHDRSHARPKRMERRIWRAHQLCRSRRTPDFLHLRPHGISGPQWHARASGGARTRRPLSGKAGRGLDPCAALQTASNCARERVWKFDSCSARRKTGIRRAN